MQTEHIEPDGPCEDRYAKVLTASFSTAIRRNIYDVTEAEVFIKNDAGTITTAEHLTWLKGVAPPMHTFFCNRCKAPPERKTICIDANSAYLRLAWELFPNAQSIADSFHVSG